ncbi:MAG: hypothetical protein AAFQ29_13590, partial [Pseudomonadota bacterium]
MPDAVKMVRQDRDSNRFKGMTRLPVPVGRTSQINAIDQQRSLPIKKVYCENIIPTGNEDPSEIRHNAMGYFALC